LSANPRGKITARIPRGRQEDTIRMGLRRIGLKMSTAQLGYFLKSVISNMQLKQITIITFLLK
jgi:hypothetical protein